MVDRLLRETPPHDLIAVTASQGDNIIGAILFTRLWFGDDARLVFLMAPVAVAPGHQAQGVGQKLIEHGLETLRARGVDAAFTYGDPAYYGRSGFQPVSQQNAPPPHPLSQPIGWLAQPLTCDHLAPLPAPSRCVAGFNDPALW